MAKYIKELQYTDSSGNVYKVDTRAIKDANNTSKTLKDTLDSKANSADVVPKTTTVNGHALSSNVTVTASDVGLGNVGNFKAVSTVANQGLTTTEQSNARTNIGAGTSSLTIGTTSTTAAAGNHDHNSTYLKLTGGNITGNLTVSGTITEDGTTLSNKYQSKLPNASAAGKILKATNTSGGVEWGDGIAVVQNTGTSTTNVMSQKATTDALNNKQDELTAGTNINISNNTISCNINTPLADTLGGSVYNTSAIYNINDYIIYDGKRYKCIVDISTPEQFNPQHWQLENLKTYTDNNIEAVKSANGFNNNELFYDNGSNGTINPVNGKNQQTSASNISLISAPSGTVCTKLTLKCLSSVVSWPNTIKWNGGFAPDFSAGDNIVELYGTNGVWYGSYKGSYIYDEPNPSWGAPWGGNWDWSNFIAHGGFVKTSRCGRRLGRHPSRMGTVMEINDNGTIKNILVLDAQYRSRAYHVKQGDVPGIQYHTKTGWFDIQSWTRTDGREYYLDSPYGPQKIPDGDYAKYFTDEKMNINVLCNQDTETSKYNTDQLIAYDNTATKAPGYCRSIVVGGVHCDLPTINILTRMFADGLDIDSLDPSIISYPTYKLGTWCPAGATNNVWSSSLYSSVNALYVHWYGRVTNYTRETNSYGVFPVLEI